MSKNNYNLYDDVEEMRKIVKEAEKAFYDAGERLEEQLKQLDKEFPGMEKAIIQIGEVHLGLHSGNEDIIKATKMLVEYFQTQLSLLEADKVFNC